MKPLQVPYNLRSRDHVVDYRDSTSRRPKRGKVSTGSIVLEDPHGKEERIANPERPTGKYALEHPHSKKKRKPKRVTHEESIREEEEKIQLQLDDPISQEELEEQYERVSKKFFLEKMYPYPLMAMKHYNKNRRKEEQFEVTEDVTGVCLKHGNVGFFHSLHFRARPKRVGKILQNSSDEVDFFALLHMMPNDDTTHVCYCMRNPDSNPPDPHAPLSQYIPLRCEVCGIPENQGKSRGPKCSTREDLKKD